MKELLLSFVLKKTISFCLSYTPAPILRLLFNLLYRISYTFTIKILRQVSVQKLSKIQCQFINKSQIISSLESKKYIHNVIAEEKFESVRTPDIFNISKNNFVRLLRQEISLYLFNNVSFSANSDILKLNNGVYWEKANRREFSQMIPLDNDFINVAKVLNLSVGQKVFKIILPSAFPLIFTGLRITVSVAWMVLIAIELLSQSPGLGTFVWEEFQNGANDSNAKIIVAMFVIGIIGFLLDRLMLTIQNWVSFDKTDAI